jgi:hypothetical protein
MRQSHVDRRAKRYAARQYVSDTHDHKPDADARRPKADEPVQVSVAPEPIDPNRTT